MNRQKVLIYTLLNFCLLLFLSQNSFAQTPSEIFKNSVDAFGGFEKIDEIKAWKISGHMHSPEIDDDLPIVFYYKSPQFYRFEFELFGAMIYQVLASNSAWLVNPLSGSDSPVNLEREKLIMLEIYGRLFSGFTRNFNSPGFKLAYVGKEEHGDKTYIKLNLKSFAKQTIWVYLDVENLLVHKILFNPGDEENKQTLIVEDRRTVEGFEVPEKIIISNGMDETILDFEEFELNPELEDNFFKHE